MTTDSPPSWTDLVCAICTDSARMHPAEPWVAQVRLFLSMHRHPSHEGKALPVGPSSV